MASELSWRHTATGATLYATIRDASRQYWSTAGSPAFEALTVANWANYALTGSETPSSGYFYVFTWPTGLTSAGWYWVDLYVRAGGAPAISDTLAATLLGYWDGTKFSPEATDAVHVGGTAQTAGDLAATLAAIKGVGWTNETLVSIQAAAEGTGGGTGARTVVVTVTDGSDPLEDATVRLIKGGVSYVLATNASGVATFALDDGTYALAVSLAGWTMTPTTVVVDGAEAVAVTMTQTVIPAPSDPDGCVCFLYTRSIHGVAVGGSVVTFRLLAPGAVLGAALDNTDEAVTSGVDGLVSIMLPRGAVAGMRNASGQMSTFRVPEAASYELPSIII